jgi:hypothetical protein
MKPYLHYPGRTTRSEYCFHVSASSGVFLEDPMTFLHLSCRIPRDPVAGIIDLGIKPHVCSIVIREQLESWYHIKNFIRINYSTYLQNKIRYSIHQSSEEWQVISYNKFSSYLWTIIKMEIDSWHWSIFIIFRNLL